MNAIKGGEGEGRNKANRDIVTNNDSHTIHVSHILSATNTISVTLLPATTPLSRRVARYRPNRSAELSKSLANVF